MPTKQRSFFAQRRFSYMMMRAVAASFIALASSLAIPRVASAQGLISIGAGGGGGFGTRNSSLAGGTHGAAYVQLHPPLLPFAIRADALLSRVGTNNSALSLMGDAVALAPLPYVVPYALVGYGQYGVGSRESQSGWNAGIGARVRLPSFAIYAEVRRHQRIDRDLFTIGLSR